MSGTPREIGTLIVVVLKARHLPNKRHIGKQDPYCSVVFNGEKRRTKAIKRGGQHPEWDEEVRFTLYEDLEDELARTPSNGEAPRPPPKNHKPKIRGGKKLLLSCFADDPREPDIIGETSVDLTEVLTKGETDEWFTLTHKDRYCGDVYLELTFWSNEPEPEKERKPKVQKQHKQYGGAGSFVPAGSLPSALANGPNAGRHVSMGSVPPGGRSNLLPPSLRTSSSLASLDLYVAPYEEDHDDDGHYQPNPVDQIVSDFTGMGLQSHHRPRSESFPPVQSTHASYTPKPPSPTYDYSPSGHPASYETQYLESGGYDYDELATPTTYSSYDTPTSYQLPVQTQATGYSGRRPLPHRGGRHSLPASSSGFVPLPSATPAPAPALSGFAPLPWHSTDGTGYNSTPAPTSTPVPVGYSHSYGPESNVPMPSAFTQPAPYNSQPLYHQPASSTYPYSHYPPPPPASAPPQHQPHLSQLPHVTMPPPPQSAPPQVYQSYAVGQEIQTPGPPVVPPIATGGMATPGSRPLPQPSPHRQSSLTSTPPASTPLPQPPQVGYNPLLNPPPPPPSSSFAGISVPPPPPLPSQSPSHTPPMFGAGSHSPTYSTPALFGPPSQVPNGLALPPPPPPPLHGQGGHSPTRPALPQPPVTYQPVQTAYSAVPPPPPLSTPPGGQGPAYHPVAPRPPAHTTGAPQWIPAPPPLATGNPL